VVFHHFSFVHTVCTPFIQEKTMTLCPIAIVSGCAKCPAFKVCPLKEVLGDQVKSDAPAAAADSKPKSKKK
jgi:hypothetical protein